VPNPAHSRPNRCWLNEALMAGAVAHSPRLENIIERPVAGDSLGFHPKRARSDERKAALSEPAAAAGVVDPRRQTRVANHRSAAACAAMLELSQSLRIGDAQAHRRASGARDLPKAALRLGQRRWADRGETETAKNGHAGRGKAWIAVHVRQFITIFVPGN
jgi:hypothetical protein